MTELEPRPAHVPTSAETVIKAGLNLVPVVGGTLAVLYEDFTVRRRARVQEMSEAALHQLHHDPAWFVHRLEADERFAELFVRAAEGAARSAVPGKAAALGRLVADAAEMDDPGEFDKLELLTLALVDLEAPHVRALSGLARYPTDPELEEMFPGDSLAVEGSSLRRDRVRFLGSLPAPVISVLVSHGLAHQTSSYGLFVDGVTNFGKDLLKYMERAAEAGG